MKAVVFLLGFVTDRYDGWKRKSNRIVKHLALTQSAARVMFPPSAMLPVQSGKKERGRQVSPECAVRVEEKAPSLDCWCEVC